jgi:hypothetical protein
MDAAIRNPLIKDKLYHFVNYNSLSLKHIDFKRASGMIKFLTGSCLSGLGIVMKKPQAI